ncbi:hypothetical protein EAO71_19770 [Streptomyces sp. ms191]|uniref:hypothetical protein n=1 Tax=Streptomyces sp. ms191 TaxID=1827978 RepID=UPI0011CD9683|nr:hypothetical protein [Streptomyces sp. ms191]TXS30655.1 hypothetical protein EAO71_19770 [Streptomyces sp. ms191]
MEVLLFGFLILFVVIGLAFSKAGRAGRAGRRRKRSWWGRGQLTRDGRARDPVTSGRARVRPDTGCLSEARGGFRLNN